MRAAPGNRRLENLPADLTSFVDRRQQMTDIRRSLSTSRLLTLTGVGGVGKTRLALRAAAQLRRLFRDGVWLVDLAPLGDEELLASTVAAELGVPDHSTHQATALLTEFLSDKQLLLILDNCEHLLKACAELATDVLRTCHDVRILTTSRQPLGVYGEQVMEVPSLTDSKRSAQPMLDRPDVTLFAERASALSDFTLTPENAATVAELCDRLDGLPLAIELAAVRIRGLTVEQILQRLTDRFELLSTGTRGAPARQQTLRALMDWSYDLCSPEEQRLWARVSVFAGGFDLEAVEDVCAEEGGLLTRGWIVDGLTKLVDKSILIRTEPDGRVRYRVLETVRQYGHDLLARSGEQRWVRRRHCDYYMRMAERAEAEWFGPHQQAWSWWLRTEQANMRAAMDFCYAEPDRAETGLRIASALRVYWLTGTGSINEGRRWLERLLETHPDQTTVRAKALSVYAWLALLQNDVAGAMPSLTAGRALAERLGDEMTLAYVTQLSGAAEEIQGNLAAARPLLEDAVVRHRSLGDRMGVTFALGRLARVTLAMGELDRAVRLCEQSVALSAEHEEDWSRAHALWIMGMALWQRGDYQRAATLERESIRLKGIFHDLLGIAVAMETLAGIATDCDQPERAAFLLGALDGHWRSTKLALPDYMNRYHDRNVQKTEDALGSATYAKAWQEGAAWSLDDAIDFASRQQAAQPTGSATVPAPREESTPLTRRQTEIAELIAQGLSNREIANRLVISQRTAETHVENILTKMGFTSRAQIAAWVAERETASG